MSDQPKCELCGEPMPQGEEVFKYHGYSGNCPKPPLNKHFEERKAPIELDDQQCDQIADLVLKASGSALRHYSMAKTIEDIRNAVRAGYDAMKPTKRLGGMR